MIYEQQQPRDHFFQPELVVDIKANKNPCHSLSKVRRMFRILIKAELNIQNEERKANDIQTRLE